MSGFGSRGYLPHLDFDATQFITFRLFDSLPKDLIDQWRAELEAAASQEKKREIASRVEHWCDKGLGECFLRQPEVAQVVEEALLDRDGSDYRLIAWTIMPNHVHVLAQIPSHLPQIVRTWKGKTAREANLVLGRTGPFWYREYFDRYMRDADHLQRVRDYIEENPVKAGLCRRPQDWPFGSARLGDRVNEFRLDHLE